MSAVQAAPHEGAASQERAAVAGYVEATTPTAVLGWAWMPGQAAALVIELRAGSTAVAETRADELRDDLARNGIGEGRHAFTLPVPHLWRDRLHELRVFARTPEGAVVPLGSPPPEDPAAAKLAQIHRGIEMLVGSQRVLHRNLQAALLARAEVPAASGGGAGPEGAGQGEAVQEAIVALEVFVARLEQALAATPALAKAARAPRWGLACVAGMAATSLGASVWALLRSMP